MSIFLCLISVLLGLACGDILHACIGESYIINWFDRGINWVHKCYIRSKLDFMHSSHPYYLPKAPKPDKR